MTYTYDDIVTAKDILTGKVKKEDIIGKRGWFLLGIPLDMSLNTIVRVCQWHGVLQTYDEDMAFPFRNVNNNGCTYFLPEKEESAPEPVIKEKTYKERQDEWLRANGIREGDKLRIVRKAESHEDGWDDTWEPGMNNEVGNIGHVVVDNGDKGIAVYAKCGSWNYPYFVLEKVEDEPAYIPFDLSDPKDRGFLRDKWVKAKTTGIEAKVIGFGAVEVILIDRGYTTDELLEEFTFLDGSPVGKPANGQQMASK